MTAVGAEAVSINVVVSAVLVVAIHHAIKTGVPHSVEGICSDIVLVVMHVITVATNRVIIAAVALVPLSVLVNVAIALERVPAVVLVPPTQEILYFYYYINTFND